MTQHLALVANAGDATISAFAVGDALAPLATTKLPGASSTFAVDPYRDLVHVACKGTPPLLVTYRLDRTRGVLTEVARTPLEAPLAYVELAHEGTVLLGASYHAGAGYSWPVRDGVPGGVASRIAFQHLHCVAATREGRAYFVSLGDDLVAQYAVSDAGVLTPLAEPTVALPQGSGARHLAFDADQRSGYLVTEFSGEVFRLERDAGGLLQARERVSIVNPDAGLRHSRLGADPAAEHLVWGADVHVADGFLVASERSASTLAVVPLSPDGALGAPVTFTPTERQPRGFGLLPGGRVLAVGEKSTHLALSVLEPGGPLRLLDRVETGRGANWIRTLPLDAAGAGVHGVDRSVDEAASAWRAAGWRVGVVTGGASRADALVGIGEALGFPTWYGRNLDALWDCLTDLTAPTALVVDGDLDPAVLEVLTDRARQEPPFAVVLAGRTLDPGGS